MEDIIYNLELELTDPKVRKSSDKLNQLIDDEFIVFGMLGKVYDKQALLQTLPHEKDQVIQIRDFKATILSQDVMLATYQAIISGIISLHSSIWKHKDLKWKMVFHQGTIIQE